MFYSMLRMKPAKLQKNFPPAGSYLSGFLPKRGLL